MTYAELTAKNLPFNRKERYFTGTVLPSLLTKDNFKYCNRFLNLISNSNPLNIKTTRDAVNIQLFTEYNFFESAVLDPRYSGKPIPRDTPDILILVDENNYKTIYIIEAKMYDTPDYQSLKIQMENQMKALKKYDKALNLNFNLIYHSALLPKELLDKYIALKQYHETDFKCITWQEVLEEFRKEIPDDYFVQVLEYALDKYEDLVSKYNEHAFGKNSDGRIPGEEIMQKHSKLGIKRIGRRKGLFGEFFLEDLESGRWKSFKYEYGTDSRLPNNNWFTIDDFLNIIKQYSSNTG